MRYILLTSSVFLLEKENKLTPVFNLNFFFYLLWFQQFFFFQWAPFSVIAFKTFKRLKFNRGRNSAPIPLFTALKGRSTMLPCVNQNSNVHAFRSVSDARCRFFFFFKKQSVHVDLHSTRFVELVCFNNKKHYHLTSSSSRIELMQQWAPLIVNDQELEFENEAQRIAFFFRKFRPSIMKLIKHYHYSNYCFIKFFYFFLKNNFFATVRFFLNANSFFLFPLLRTSKSNFCMTDSLTVFRINRFLGFYECLLLTSFLL
jgi:hypothetical protein